MPREGSGIAARTFHYADLFEATRNDALGTALPLPGIVLPIGISFFTFQGTAQLVDVRRDEGSERSPAAEAVARHRVVEPPAPVVELGEGLDHHGVSAGHPGDPAEHRLAHPLPLLEGAVCEGQARRVARHEADTAEGGGVGQRQGRVRLLGAGQLGLALEGAGGARALASEVCAGERGLGEAPGQQHQVHTVAAAHLEHAPRG